MEEIYVNVDEVKPKEVVTRVTQLSLNSGLRQNNSKHSKKCRHLYVFVFLGLLNVFLLSGLVIICVLNHDRADLIDIRQNLTERLEIANLQIFNLTEERNQLKANLTEISEKIESLPEICPTGWNKFSSSCYLVSDQSDSWSEGREDCKRRGADLVVIESSEEKDFLVKISNKVTWIGLSDREQEGSWKWVNGAPLNFTFWHEAQPDDWKGNEDCVHIFYDSTWNDLSCSSSNLWICEKKAMKLV